jgi:hypothetical protein
MEIIFGIDNNRARVKMKSAQNHLKSHSRLSPLWVAFYCRKKSLANS